MRLSCARVSVLAAFGLAGLTGCSAGNSYGDLTTADQAAAYAITSPDTTGSITARPAAMNATTSVATSAPTANAVEPTPNPYIGLLGIAY